MKISLFLATTVASAILCFLIASGECAKGAANKKAREEKRKAAEEKEKGINKPHTPLEEFKNSLAQCLNARLKKKPKDMFAGYVCSETPTMLNAKTCKMGLIEEKVKEKDKNGEILKITQDKLREPPDMKKTRFGENKQADSKCKTLKQLYPQKTTREVIESQLGEPISDDDTKRLEQSANFLRIYLYGGEPIKPPPGSTGTAASDSKLPSSTTNDADSKKPPEGGDSDILPPPKPAALNRDIPSDVSATIPKSSSDNADKSDAAKDDKIVTTSTAANGADKVEEKKVDTTGGEAGSETKTIKADDASNGGIADTAKAWLEWGTWGLLKF